MTDWHKANVRTDTLAPVESDFAQGPLLQAHHGQAASHHSENDLIAGTTTTKEIGVVVYPEGHGTMIWGELLTVPHRSLNPYDVAPETRRLLHHEVFPYWIQRNFKEWVRQKYGQPLCQQIDER